jgi:hypothetical protein
MIDPLSIAVGVLVFAGGVWLLTIRERVAEWVHEQTNRYPDPTWRPRWLPWRFRATVVQARVIAILFGLLVLGFGLFSALAGMGLLS